jgi:hypothetical protein
MAKLPAYLENLDEIDDTLKGLFVETKDKDGKTWFVLDLDDTVKQHPWWLPCRTPMSRRRSKTAS